ncbi:MAG TPA: hypothetical protein VLZ89_10840 [Anaerolineales bacterium]|nr:hypothetical protein [Anaerolineales bacterium]
MDSLKKFFGGGPAAQGKRYYVFRVKCDRCGEILEGRVDLDNDLSVEYEGNNAVYFGRKALMSSSGQCFQQIEVELTFNVDRKLLEAHSVGGQLTEGR